MWGSDLLSHYATKTLHDIVTHIVDFSSFKWYFFDGPVLSVRKALNKWNASLLNAWIKCSVGRSRGTQSFQVRSVSPAKRDKEPSSFRACKLIAAALLFLPSPGANWIPRSLDKVPGVMSLQPESPRRAHSPFLNLTSKDVKLKPLRLSRHKYRRWRRAWCVANMRG